jgi:hypothetical protein
VTAKLRQIATAEGDLKVDHIAAAAIFGAENKSCFI